MSNEAEISYQQMSTKSFFDVQSAIRNNLYSGHTAGLVADCLQGNVVILSEEFALDFAKFCQRNPKSCPLIAISDVGNPNIPHLGANINICTDVPGFYIYENGEFIRETQSITEYWQTDSVAFILGCSFGFEHELLRQGIRLKHIEENKTVPMFVTNIETQASGIFHGNMVVSMRTLSKQDAIKATIITSRFPESHGAPIHFGDPAQIGIHDIMQPDFGDAVPVGKHEIPVFWPCGVTPQIAIQNAKLPICISHAPGKMLITNRRSG